MVLQIFQCLVGLNDGTRIFLPRSKSVVDIGYDIPRIGEGHSVLLRLLFIAGYESPSVYPHNDGKLLVGMLRMIDIEEAILNTVLIIYNILYDMDLLIDRLDVAG